MTSKARCGASPRALSGRRLLSACAFMCLLWPSPGRATVAAECAPVATAGPEAEEIRRLELRGAEVNVQGWGIAEARGFFAPDFVSVGADGTVTRLDRVLGSFTDGVSRGWAGRFEILELEIRILGCAAAIVVGLAEARPLAAPAGTPSWRIRFLNVWRRENGRWLYAANQFARVGAPPPATGGQ